jgi:2-polyprenyl-6-methoxyphenol hydroxylase-like FAD-dependent oxidoreductase
MLLIVCSQYPQIFYLKPKFHEGELDTNRTYVVCNPFGGLGLTGGLLDAASLADALTAHINERLPESILDTYATIRREVFLKLVNPTSQANKRRLHESDPSTVAETDPFLKALREVDADGKQKIRGMEGLWIDVREAWEKEQGN